MSDPIEELRRFARNYAPGGATILGSGFFTLPHNMISEAITAYDALLAELEKVKHAFDVVQGELDAVTVVAQTTQAQLTTALDSERASNAGLRCEVLSLKADIETAILALRNSYDATEWPADGTSGCEIAAKALEEKLNIAPTTETKGGK